MRVSRRVVRLGVGKGVRGGCGEGGGDEVDDGKGKEVGGAGTVPA